MAMYTTTCTWLVHMNGLVLLQLATLLQVVGVRLVPLGFTRLITFITLVTLVTFPLIISLPFSGASPMFPLGTVPLGLNHLGSLLPEHYPRGEIPFLQPPFGVFSVPFMASLVLPNMTLGISIWYINPRTSILPG